MQSDIFGHIGILGLTQGDGVFTCTQPDRVKLLIRTKIIRCQSPGSVIIHSVLIRPSVPLIDNLIKVT